MLKVEEIPLWAGLIEFDFEQWKKDKDKKGYYLSYPISAPLHAKGMPSWGLICSMIRHINKDLGLDALTNSSLKLENKHLKQDREEMRNLLSKIANFVENNSDAKSLFEKDLESQGIKWSLFKYRQ